MGVSGVEIRVGQTWRTRGGAKASVLSRVEDDGAIWPFVCSDDRAVDAEGCYLNPKHPSEHDLVELIVQAPELPPLPTSLVGDEHEALTFHPLNDRRWSEWSGGECPVAANAMILVVLRGDRLAALGPFRASDARWEHNGEDGDIVGFKVVRYNNQPVDNDLPVQMLGAEPLEISTNPKDAIGSTKLPMHLWPAEATALGCLGMLEGDEKYGRNNYVAGNGVIASIYIDAAKRHLDAWFAGEECAPDSGVPHLANALASIAIIVKARAHGKLKDDRDYSPVPNGAAYRAFVEQCTPHVARLQQLFKDKHPKRYTIADQVPAFERKKPADTEGGAA